MAIARAKAWAGPAKGAAKGAKRKRKRPAAIALPGAKRKKTVPGTQISASDFEFWRARHPTLGPGAPASRDAVFGVFPERAKVQLRRHLLRSGDGA